MIKQRQISEEYNWDLISKGTRKPLCPRHSRVLISPVEPPVFLETNLNKSPFTCKNTDFCKHRIYAKRRNRLEYFYVYGCFAHLYVCAPHSCSTNGGQKRASMQLTQTPRCVRIMPSLRLHALRGSSPAALPQTHQLPITWFLAQLQLRFLSDLWLVLEPVSWLESNQFVAS